MAQRQARSDDTSIWNDGYGTGSAGAKTFSVDTTDDATLTPKTTLTSTISTTAGTVGSFTGFADGDLVMLYQTRNGGDGAGTWELNKIASHSGLNVTFAYTTTHNYGTTAQMIKLVQYQTVVANSTKTVTAQAWDGSVGGVLPIMASRSIDGPGTFSVKGKGFRGGVGRAAGGNPGGFGDAGESGTGATVQQSSANGTGGGAGQGYVSTDGRKAGAGGGYATAGSNGGTAGGTSGLAIGGGTSGVASLVTAEFGGAGGGAGAGGGESGGDGAPSGGFVFLFAPNIGQTNPPILNIKGDDSAAGTFASGGAGAGGSGLAKGVNVAIDNASVGAGGTAGSATTVGGNAGVGRFHVDYASTVSGTTSPTINSTQDSTLFEQGAGMFFTL